MRRKETVSPAVDFVIVVEVREGGREGEVRGVETLSNTPGCAKFSN